MTLFLRTLVLKLNLVCAAKSHYRKAREGCFGEQNENTFHLYPSLAIDFQKINNNVYKKADVLQGYISYVKPVAE